MRRVGALRAAAGRGRATGCWAGLGRCAAGLAWTLIVPGAAAVDPAVVLVPVAGEQVSGGPGYDLRIGVYQITNQQFVTFLNDAQANPNDPRGHYLYFATDTGNVYVHSSMVGAQGADAGGTPVLDIAANGRIELTGGVHDLIDPAFADHPVTGVSWYGAVKFCNWLTVWSGLSSAQRAYTEAPSSDLAGWHPVTISYDDWAVRDLDATERQTLLALWGYRLPMDDDWLTESAYNEWYKAAAHDGAGGHWTYGFGRDVTDGGRDGNYWASGDPFDNDTTPVGFFDGVNLLADGVTTTLDTGNFYGLYDMSGNVWEWVQDQGENVDRRAVRGGSWSNSVGAMGCDVRATRAAATAAWNTGFRVAQSAPQPLLVVPDAVFEAEGPYGGAYDLASTDYLITNVSEAAVNFRVESDADWITLNGAPALPGQTLQPAQEATVTVALEVACTSAAVVGLNTGTVTLTDDDTQAIIVQRTVDLTLTEPLDLTPQADQTAAGFEGGPFVPAQIDYTIDNASASTMEWQVDCDVLWLTVDGQVSSAGGTVVGLGQYVVAAVFNSSADALTAGQHTAQLTFTDQCSGEQFTRSIILDVSLPMSVTPADDAAFEGRVGGPFLPADYDYTIINLSDVAIQWDVTASPPVSWLDIDGAASASGTLNPLDSVVVKAEPNIVAGSLPPGTYTTQLTFSDNTNGYQATRDVTLTVLEFEVTPTADLYSQGPTGGPFSPMEQIYTITYSGVLGLEWQATYTTADGGSWLNLNGAQQAAGWILEPGGTADVTVRINNAAAALAPGSYSATVSFADLGPSGAAVTRGVNLVIGEGGFTVAMSVVWGAGQDQPGGPDYDYRIGVYELTNAQFAAFLTSAANNPGNARGAFMYHDTDSGDVYINANSNGLGEVGTNGAGTLMFKAGDGGAIQYDNVLQSYQVTAGMENLPVVGVSWYGVVKFCNWMTLAQGMGASHQAYGEGPDPTDWLPVATNDVLAASVSGFRLPMDDGASTASAYNEWYKAAAWLSGSGQHAVYGFGRDSLIGPDANYLSSGDPHDADNPPLAPVGFFDGVNLLGNGQTVTADTGNAYQLYDMCGNAAEWVHQPGTTRGGNAFNASTSNQLQADQRVADLPEATRGGTGFRVAQSLLAAPIEVTPGTDFAAVGVAGGPMSAPTSATYTLTGSPLSSNEWLVSTDVGWLDVNQMSSAYGVVPPGGTQPVTIALNQAADALLVPGEYTATVMFLDQTTGGTTTARQVTLTLSDALAVAPKTDLIASGPFRGAQPPADPFDPITTSYTLTNDSDTAMAWQVSVDAGWIDLEVNTNGTDPAGLVAGEQVFVDVSINASAQDLLPGLHQATVSFTNTTNGNALSRKVELTVTDAVSVTTAGTAVFDLDDLASLAVCLTGPGGGPLDVHCAGCDFDLDDDLDLADFSAFALAFARNDFVVTGLWGGPFESLPDQATYTLSNLLAIPLDYTVSADVNWLSLTGDPLTGSLAVSPDQVSFTAAANANADSLGVGRYRGTITFRYEDTGVGTSETRTAWLYVDDLLEVVETAGAQGIYNPPAAPAITVPAGGVYALRNLSGTQQVGWQANCDQSWVTLDGGAQTSGDLLPLQETTVTVGLAAEAQALVDGVYTATVTFTDLPTGSTTTRLVTLTVTETLGVEPWPGLDAFGELGGPGVTPDQKVYTLTNRTGASLTWSASADRAWVQIDGAASAGGTLDPGAQTTATVSIVAGYAEPSDSAAVSFINVTDGNTTAAARPVTVTLTPPFGGTAVPGDDGQPGGPTYSFEVATFEVTNDDFVAFVNSALANPADERGYYLYFATDTGYVYLHTAQAGATGLDTGGTSVLDVGVNGHIVLNGGTYELDDVSYGSHPVTGVSWYGALKYCNWLTIESGGGVGQRCYNEGPSSDLDEWRPVTITKAAWQGRDLNDAERQSLVNDYRGFRLPMDDGSNNADPWSDAADAYNEWYKAAAWCPNPAPPPAGVNHVFGFGRDDFTTDGADANYWNSGDPFDNDTAPVGFYDGTLYNPGGGGVVGNGVEFQTAADQNCYGLYDMSGNVAEWVQDRYGGLSTRALRGGSWANQEAQVYWLRTFDRDFASPSLAWDTIGFRVVRVPVPPGG